MRNDDCKNMNFQDPVHVMIIVHICIFIFYSGDGSCKHVVALLFGLADLIISMEDRTAIGVTDAAAYWDKPRKVCRPVTVHDLDIRYI